MKHSALLVISLFAPSLHALSTAQTLGMGRGNTIYAQTNDFSAPSDTIIAAADPKIAVADSLTDTSNQNFGASKPIYDNNNGVSYNNNGVSDNENGISDNENGFYDNENGISDFADSTWSLNGVSLLLSDSVSNKNLAASAPFLRNKGSIRRTPYYTPAALWTASALMVGVGMLGIESDWMHGRNREVGEEVRERFGHKMRFDDFVQYAPLAALGGLNLGGYRGRHGWGDVAVLSGTSYALMAAVVCTLKRITNVERPDGSSHNSFPSGHTATAFTGAELLRREYWHRSPWIGVGAYGVAAGIGFMRMYNNRHWMTDVLAGAGIGMLSVEVAYRIYPWLSRHLFRGLYRRNIYLQPDVSEGQKGVMMGWNF